MNKKFKMLSKIENLIYKKDALALDSFLSTLKYQEIIEPSNVNNDTLLHLAVKVNSKEVLKVGLKYFKKEDVDTLNSQKLNPLILAILENNFEFTQLLFDDGNMIDKNRGIHGNILHTYLNASKTYDIKMIQFIINNLPNLNINQLDGFGKTALDYACSSEKENTQEVIDFLLAHDANPYVCDAEKKNALYYAVAFGKVETIHYLLKNFNFDLNQKFYEANLPILDKFDPYYNLAHIAYYKGSSENFKFIVSRPEFYNTKTIEELEKLTKNKISKESKNFLFQLKEKVNLESVVSINDVNKLNKSNKI